MANTPSKLEQIQQMKPAADTTFAGIAGGSFIGILPELAAGISILWFGLQILERYVYKALIKPWLQKRKDKKEGDN